MKHADFIVWMCAFPVAQAAAEAIRWQFCEREVYTRSSRVQAEYILAFIYFGVGIFLW